MVCNRCQKRPAIIFVQRMENGQMKNEGFCLHCARELHIKPVEDLMKQFGMSDEDMDNMENRNLPVKLGKNYRRHLKVSVCIRMIIHLPMGNCSYRRM